MDEKKNKGGRTRIYKDQDFLNVLSDKPMTTSAVKEELHKIKGYEKIVTDTVLKNLLRLAEDPDSGVIKDEIKAASREGKIYLWKKKEP